ncbi:MAG: hypothetical protein HY756_03335 [Nitrospirae bacterium]|nr:hypothetical protein [Nitrospirota bacterium]
MLRKLIGKREKTKKAKDKKDLLTLELAEIEEIAQRLFNRIDERISVLKSVSAEVDEKISALESLLQKVKELNVPPELSTDTRRKTVIALSKKGLKIDEIARIFDMPRGEVELMLELHHK